MGEVDLRLELDILLYGDSTHAPHGHPALLRRMREGSDQGRQECVCKQSLTLEADPHCSYCGGEGYYWDEQWVITYKQFLGSDGGMANRGRWIPGGRVSVDDIIFYFRYDTPLREWDKIVEVELDLEGAPVVPYVRKVIYSPRTVDYLRSDGGRVEYIAAFCREEDIRMPDR